MLRRLWHRIFVGWYYWVNTALTWGSFWRFLRTIFLSFGSLWLVIKASSFLDKSGNLKEVYQDYWWVLLLTSAVIAIFRVWPKIRFSCRLRSRDVKVEIVIGDIFREAGTFIIPTNTTFDTDTDKTKDSISPNSIQGQYSSKYYKTLQHLDADIEAELAQFGQGEQLEGDRKGKSLRYDIGSTVKLLPNQKGEAYMVAIAHMNAHGTANSNFENILAALPRMWSHIIDRGGMNDLIIPVVGSGFSRLKETQFEIIQEIIRSFIVACSSDKFCSKLKIVIHPKDFKENELDINELRSFLEAKCKWADYEESESEEKIGKGIN